MNEDNLDYTERSVEDVEDNMEEESEVDTENDNVVDYIQARIDQVITVGELNTLLQTLFAQYNTIYLLASDLYNVVDIDEPQELVVWDDDIMYTIIYDIVDLDKGQIKITDVLSE